MSDLKQLYRNSLRRHASEPQGYRQEIQATHRHEAYNPQCGDRVEVYFRMAGDHIEAVGFDGEACTICMASASMLCASVSGQSKGQLAVLEQALVDALKPNAQADPPGELAPLAGVRAYPSRVQCATLPWKAAVKALI